MDAGLEGTAVNRLVRARALGVAVLVVAVLGAAACGPRGDGARPVAGASGGSAGTAAGAPGGGGTRAGGTPCVVGAWRSDGYKVDSDVATVTGGSGFSMEIAPDGAAAVDFAGMQPVTITVTVSGASINSQVVYSGKASGRLKLPPAGAATGNWAPEPGVDWGSVRVTMELGGSKLFDNVPLADLAKDAGGAASGTNTQPVLGSGSYTCSGDKLTVEQETTNLSVSWVLHREG
jgi:hypothetical protein